MKGAKKSLSASELSPSKPKSCLFRTAGSVEKALVMAWLFGTTPQPVVSRLAWASFSGSPFSKKLRESFSTSSETLPRLIYISPEPLRLSKGSITQKSIYSTLAASKSLVSSARVIPPHRDCGFFSEPSGFRPEEIPGTPFGVDSKL